MPRLLPRLVEEVQRVRAKYDSKVFDTRSNFSPKVKHATSSRLAAVPQTFSFRGRRQSLLLDKVNPILHRESFSHKKSKKPSVRKVTNEGNDENSMSFAERGFSSNPYLIMLSSPIRRCMLTDRLLPTDFMVRLAILRVSSSRLGTPYIALLPDGVEHPRYRRQNSGRGYYIVCYKRAVIACIHRKLKRMPSAVKIHSLLAEQIGFQLRNRVLQELELLAERLKCVPQRARESVILRRLTRSEWEGLRLYGQITQPGAVAVLIVPPIQKTTLLQAQEGKDYHQKTSAHPLSELYPCATIPASSAGLQLSSPSLHMIPIYNSVTLFPSPLLRHELYTRLQAILTMERNARWRQASTYSQSIRDGVANEKSSHAYIIFADHDTIRRSDSTPLVVALWRLRLWEGQGWDSSKGDYGEWMAK